MSHIERFLGKNPHKDTIFLVDIETLIQARVEENVNLDYKEMPDQKKYDSFLNEIAKDVSAFLNSDGGLLILGVSEKRRPVGHSGKITKVGILPDKITWGTLTKERLEGSLKGKVQPWNQEILIVPVRNPENDAQCIFLVDIPKSKVAPHMADHRFFIRSNFESSLMEYWQVAEMFSRNWTQKRDLVTFVYGPIYNEIESFLDRRRKCRQFSISKYNEVLNNHAYLLNQADWNFVENIRDFYDTISELNRCLQDAPLIITKIVDKVTSIFLGLSDKDRPVTIYVGIEADLAHILPTIDVLILERKTPTEWMKEQRPNATVLSVKNEMRFPDSRTEILDEEQFRQILDLSKKEAEKNEVIEFIWKKEDELEDWAGEILEMLQKLM